MSRLSFYGKLLPQLDVASTPRRAIFLQWYSIVTVILWANKWWWCCMPVLSGYRL